MKFTAIHISDIHPQNITSSKEAYRDEIIDKLNESKITNADCLIISGDLFHRGSLSKEEAAGYRTFLNKIPGHDCIIVVPGNHDLDRMARIPQKEGYNTYHNRKSIVRIMGDSAKEKGEFSCSDDEKIVLYQESFRSFFEFSKKMKFKSFSVTPGKKDQVKYELQRFDVPLSEEPNKKIRFVLINTALIAGQTINENKYLELIKEKEQQYQAAVMRADTIKQAEIRLEIEKLKLSYVKEDGIIVDNESENKIGRLSLSKEGNTALRKFVSSDGLNQSEEIVYTIFVGHHGCQFLSSNTQEAIMRAMQNCESSIYLCGHAHRAHYDYFKIPNSSKPKYIEQFQSGVMFKDDSNYAQYGFNHIELNIENKKVSCSVTSYFLDKSIAEEKKWFTDRSEISNDNLPQSEEC